MALIDSEKFITHLVFGGMVDNAKCGELKEAIKLCTVKDTYSKEEVVAIFNELLSKVKKVHIDNKSSFFDDGYNCGLGYAESAIKQTIDVLKGETDV